MLHELPATPPSEPSDSAKGWSDLTGGVAVTIHQVLRYASGGLLYWLVAAVYDPVRTKQAADALGGIPVALTALALGSVAYVGCRVLVIYLFLSLLRLEEEIWWWVQPTNGWSRRHFFEKWVARQHSHEAWRVVRDHGLIDKKIQEQIHVQHSENHVPYVVVFVSVSSIFGIVIREISSHSPGALTLVFVLGLIAVASFFVGLINDAQMSFQEGAYLRALDRTVHERMESKLKASFPEDKVDSNTRKYLVPSIGKWSVKVWSTLFGPRQK